MGLNAYENLDFLVANTADELRDIIRSIPFPLEVITIYAVGTKHIAWVRTHGKIKKVTKEKSNGIRN